jgi:hypothetical protein
MSGQVPATQTAPHRTISGRPHPSGCALRSIALVDCDYDIPDMLLPQLHPLAGSLRLLIITAQYPGDILCVSQPALMRSWPRCRRIRSSASSWTSSSKASMPRSQIRSARWHSDFQIESSSRRNRAPSTQRRKSGRLLVVGFFHAEPDALILTEKNSESTRVYDTLRCFR